MNTNFRMIFYAKIMHKYLAAQVVQKRADRKYLCKKNLYFIMLFYAEKINNYTLYV